MALNEYDEILSRNQPAPSNEYESILREQRAEEKAALKTSFYAAAAADPDRHARVLQHAQRLNLPPDVVERNLDTIEQRRVVERNDYDAMLEQTPHLAAWLMESPDNAKVTHDDLPNLGLLEAVLTKARDYAGAFGKGIVGDVFGTSFSGAGELLGVASRTFEKGLDRVLPDAVMDVLRSPAPWWLDPVQLLKYEGSGLKAAGQMIAPPTAREGIGTDIAGGTGQLAGQIFNTLFFGPVASSVTLFSQGADVMADKTRGDVARQEEKDLAIVAGAGVTALTEKYGLKQILQRVPPAVRDRALRQITDIAIAGGIEAAQEFTEGLMHDLTRIALTNADAPILQGIDREMIAAGGSAALVRAVLNTALGVRVRTHAHEQEQMLTALGELSKNSKLRERVPEQLQALVERITKDGPLENVYLPIDAWNTHFQTAGVDPRAVAAQVLGGTQPYDEASRTGADLVIPMARYAVALAPTEHHKAFVRELRTSANEMSAREAGDWVAQQEVDVAAEQAAASSARIHDDVVGQLLGAGIEQQTAETYATLYQSTFRNLADRVGQDPFELYSRYGLQIIRALPEVLTRVGKLENVDVLINRLRAGDLPRDTEVFGASLVEFLKPFGLQDQGGELSARDLHKRRKMFERPLVRQSGITLDDAAEKAVEAGYLSERDPNTLLEAIDEELRGQPRYSPRRQNQQLFDTRSALEQLSEYLQQVGIDLARTDNDAIKKLLRGETPAPAQVLEQRGGEIKRGMLQIGADRRVSITLLEKADLSTFLHETGHFYLELLGDLAQDPAAPARVRADYQTLLDWFAVTSRDEIANEHHERFARAFEAYLLEGKSPSTALAKTFARFRAWLVAIYRSLTKLNVKLTDEVRGVMDRLVASDSEIAQAQGQLSMQPLFADAAQSGMTLEEFASYERAVEASRQAAETELALKFIGEHQRESEQWWRETRAEVRREVETEVNEQKTYIALTALAEGRLPNGSALPEGMRSIKLSRQALLDRYGADFLKRLPRPYIYAKDGGIQPDVAAEVFGFNSGDELVLALANARPRVELIEAETDARMRERFGDMRFDGTAAAAAMYAAHNEDRAELLLLELKKLVGRTRQRIAPLQVVRAQAERIVAQKRVRDIHPAVYQRAEAKAARAAFTAAARGDYDTAFVEKQRELLNLELYRAAAQARDDVDTTVDYMRKFGKRSTREEMGKAGADYLEQIDTILDRFDFRRATSLETVDRRKSLLAWVNEQNELGYTVDLAPRLLNEAYRQHYKDTSYEELLGIRDAVRSIEHLARTKNRLLANQRTKDFGAARADIVSSIAAHHKLKTDPPDFAPGLKKRIAENARGFFAAHTKLEFLFEHLDGNKAQGAAWQHLFKPFVDAEAAENKMMRGVVENLSRIFGAYSRKERATWFFKKTHVPEIGASLTKANMLAVALNWGNQYNREALMRGYGWDERSVQAILANLDQHDWKTVQGVWDYIDSFWPQVEQQERELSGIPPAKVEAIEVQTRFGTFRGGYYPIVFDAKLSWRQAVLEEKAHVRDLFGGHWARAMTRHGHTRERSDTGGKPVRLELSGMTEHLTNVVHDLAYRPALVDVGRLANDTEIRETIEKAAGREYYRQINPWLVAMAADQRDYSNPIEGLLGRARQGATIVNMGWKLTTAITQLLGYTVSIKELGAKYGALGLADAYGKPHRIAETWDFVTERSSLMRERLRTYDRDVRDALKKLNVAGAKPGLGSVVDAYTGEIRGSYFTLIGYMDIAVSLPTWLGAYRKALDGAVENVGAGDEPAAVDYADQIVRQTQGSGAAKDLALVQRGPEAFRIFTMFYSYFSVLFNQLAKTAHQFQIDRNAPKLLASLALLWFVPAVLQELMVGRGPDPDDDEEKWLKWIATKETLYPFQSLVFVRDVVNGMDEFGYDPSAAFDMYESLARTGKLGIKLASGEKDDVERSDVKGVVMTAGYTLGLPTRQLWLTGEYVYDWLAGDADPQNPAEAAWRALVTGKSR